MTTLRELIDGVEQQVASGRYPPGHVLTIKRLSSYYCCSPGTVHRAVAALQAKGVVDIRLGVGIRICQPGQSWDTDDADEAGQSLTQQVEIRIRASLIGWYEKGSRLPTVQAWSDALGVAPSTISAAVQRIKRDGLVESRGRAGYFATPALAKAAAAVAAPDAGRAASTTRADAARPMHPLAADHHA
ncbi:GntR family transcriptional regulator [Streptomyces sp. NPDC006703]|uniref:GntR family transcriptional regulator n=1 Tax=Streptomyces sp. NPDC006703 TaxID=3364759 RepID=UPI0036C178CE